MKASEVLDNLKRRFPNEPEYHQAVSEVLGYSVPLSCTQPIGIERHTVNTASYI